MLEVNSLLMTAALVFADKQVFFSLAPVIVGPALWTAGLIFLRLTQLRNDSLQAEKMLESIKTPHEFTKQLGTLDTVIGSLHSFSTPWQRFRKSLILPKNESAVSVVRAIDDTGSFFRGKKTGPAACGFYKDLAIKMALCFSILFAVCSLASGVFLSVFGLEFQTAGAETQVFGAFHHGFLQSSVAAVTLFILSGVMTTILLNGFSQLAERSQEKTLDNFVEKLDVLVEPISTTLVAYEQIQEVKRQSHYLSIIEKRLTSLEGKMLKSVQPGAINTKKTVHTPKLSIPPNLRYEISKFRDPLENAPDSPRPSLTTNSQLKSEKPAVLDQKDAGIPQLDKGVDIEVMEGKDTKSI